MKYSQFNAVVPFDDKYVIFNTFTNTMVAMEPFFKDLLDAAVREGVDSLSDVHPGFYDALKSNHFLVDESVDEVEKVKAIRNMVDFNDSHYHLTINPTMNCNFKCWYCYETHVKDSRMNEDIVERVNRFLTTQIKDSGTLKSFNLSWFGGEPLLYFYDIVLPIMTHFNRVVSESGIEGGVNFTTNGFLINDKMISVFKKNRVNALQITLDGYGEEHDQVRYVSATRGSYSKIMENVVLLVRSGLFVRLRINYTSININMCHLIIDDLIDLSQEERHFLTIDFHRVWQDVEPADDQFIISQIDRFRDSGFSVLSGLSMDNVRNSCYADKRNSAVIK